MHEHYDENDLAALTFILPALGLRQDMSVFTARQLDYVKAQVYTKQLPALKGLTLVPMATGEVPDYALTFTYTVFDVVGMAKIIANYADDLPRADVAGKPTTVKIQDIGDSYGYNVAELRAGQATGVNLPTRKAEAARRAVDMKINQLAMVGEEKYGITGLANNPNVTVVTLANGDWLDPATTADMMLADLENLYATVLEQSHGNHEPNVMALPPRQRGVLYSKRLGDATATTVAAFFIDQHPGFEFIAAAELIDADATGALDVGIMYELNPDNLSFEMPQPFTQLPPQARNLEMVVPCIARAGGTVIYRPLAFAKAEGI